MDNFPQKLIIWVLNDITFLLIKNLSEGILEKKSILFDGLLNFLNKPLFLGWPIDYIYNLSKIRVSR